MYIYPTFVKYAHPILVQYLLQNIKVNSARFFILLYQSGSNKCRKPLIWVFCRNDIYFVVCKKSCQKADQAYNLMSGLNGQNWEAKKGVKSHEIEKNTFVQFLLASASKSYLRILPKNKKILSIISAFIKYN